MAATATAKPEPEMPPVLNKQSGYDEGESVATDSLYDEKDNFELRRVGKRPVLGRNFAFLSILALTCTCLVTWEGTLLYIDTGLADGGPSVVIYGFILAWVGATCIYATLAELASMAPTAGGQYHWVGMLAPERYRKFLSYITGYLTVIGWQANLAATFYIDAHITLSVARFVNPSVPNEPWQLVLTFWAVVAYTTFANTVISRLLPFHEVVVLVLHIVAWPAIIIPVLHLSQHVPAPAVFQDFTNEGDLYTQGVAFIVGVTGSVDIFLGGDAAIHLAEEIQSSATTVPKAVMTGIFLNGALGFGMIVGVMFCQGNLEAAQEAATDYVFMEIFRQAIGSTAGVTTIAAILVIMQYSCGVGVQAACSRMTWSFARDHGLPGWQYIARVDERTKIPLMSVCLSAVISILLSLIIFGSSTAFNNFISISIVGLFASYFIASSLLFYLRVTGGIKDRDSHDGNVVNTTGAQVVWGPWRMPKWVGVAVNGYACVRTLFEIFWNLFPTELPVTLQNMQWSSLVAGGIVILATAWYFVDARKHWSGPIIEVNRR